MAGRFYVLHGRSGRPYSGLHGVLPTRAVPHLHRGARSVRAVLTTGTSHLSYILASTQGRHSISHQPAHVQHDPGPEHRHPRHVAEARASCRYVRYIYSRSKGVIFLTVSVPQSRSVPSRTPPFRKRSAISKACRVAGTATWKSSTSCVRVWSSVELCVLVFVFETHTIR